MKKLVLAAATLSLFLGACSIASTPASLTAETDASQMTEKIIANCGTQIEKNGQLIGVYDKDKLVKVKGQGLRVTIYHDVDDLFGRITRAKDVSFESEVAGIEHGIVTEQNDIAEILVLSNPLSLNLDEQEYSFKHIRLNKSFADISGGFRGSRISFGPVSNLKMMIDAEVCKFIE